MTDRGIVKILVAENQEETRLKLFARLSERGYEVIIATNGEDAWKLLRHEDAPSLALIDCDLPGIDGIELCRRVRQLGDDRYVYIVMRTAQSGTPEMVAGMQAGADDYIEKRCAFDELHARLRSGERILKLQEQLRIEATHDALTGTLNRRAIRNVLEKEAERAARQASSLGILLLDLDYFKRVNDSYGHSAGDFVLTQTAKRIAAPLRRYDSLGRYGGEEFLVVLPECGLQQTVEIAERVRLSIATAPIDRSGEKIAVTVSIGAAAISEDPVSIDEFIESADRALYDAKRLGRDRVMPHVDMACPERIESSTPRWAASALPNG
jgi:diguanylate cyclase (GGDEF)-like protein